MRKYRIICACIFTILHLYSNAWSYDGPVHSKINESAVKYSQLKNILINQLNIHQGTDFDLIKDGETKK
jgi:hypothetical protein